MNPDRNRAAAGAIAMLVCAILVASLALSHTVYAPGARQLQQYLASSGTDSSPLLHSYAFGESVYLVARKLYGAVAFAIVGFCTSTIFARPQRIGRTIFVVAILRTAVEIGERLMHRGDSTFESVIDIATGTAAGALGALAYNAIAKRRELRKT